MVRAEPSWFMITVVVLLTKAFLIFDWLLTLKIPHLWFLVMLLPQQIFPVCGMYFMSVLGGWKCLVQWLVSLHRTTQSMVLHLYRVLPNRQLHHPDMSPRFTPCLASFKMECAYWHILKWQLLIQHNTRWRRWFTVMGGCGYLLFWNSFAVLFADSDGWFVCI